MGVGGGQERATRTHIYIYIYKVSRNLFTPLRSDFVKTVKVTASKIWNTVLFILEKPFFHRAKPQMEK